MQSNGNRYAFERDLTDSQRFTATFSDEGSTITGRWEIAEDGTNYTADLDLSCRRVDTWRRRR